MLQVKRDFSFSAGDDLFCLKVREFVQTRVRQSTGATELAAVPSTALQAAALTGDLCVLPRQQRSSAFQHESQVWSRIASL